MAAAAHWLRSAAAFVFAAAAASAALGQSTTPARARLEEAGRGIISSNSAFAQNLKRSPVDGDPERLVRLIATIQVINLDELDARLLNRHQSRLLAQEALGQPRTHVPTLADAIAFETQNEASLEPLQEQAFRRLVQVELDPDAPPPFQATTRDPIAPVLVTVRHLPGTAARVTGEFNVRIVAVPGGQRLWHRGCSVSDWEREGDGLTIRQLECAKGRGEEQPGDLAKALDALRRGTARVDAEPVEVYVQPADRLRYESAADRVLQASCSSTGTCVAQIGALLGRYGSDLAAAVDPHLPDFEVHAFLRAQPPERLVAGFALAQVALCVWLLRRSRATDAAPAGWTSKIGLAYLALVVLAHALVIALAISPQGGGLIMLMAWIFLGLPLFAPGIVAGVLAIGFGLRSTGLREGKIVLGVLALTLPVLEVLLMVVLKSGYRGG